MAKEMNLEATIKVDAYMFTSVFWRRIIIRPVTTCFKVRDLVASAGTNILDTSVYKESLAFVRWFNSIVYSRSRSWRQALPKKSLSATFLSVSIISMAIGRMR